MTPTIADQSERGRIDAWLAAGMPATEIEQRLRDLGMARAEAARLVDDTLAGVIAADSSIRRSAGRRDLLWGAAWCLGGLALLATGLSTFHFLRGLPIGPVGLLLVSAAALRRGSLLILRALT